MMFNDTAAEVADDALSSSILGTKCHWNNVYAQEAENFRESDGADIGEIWFGKTAESRVLNWVKTHAAAVWPARDPFSLSIFDLGCGNGSMLLAFLDAGFRDITGVDYSENSIELSRNVLIARCSAEQFMSVDLFVLDAAQRPMIRPERSSEPNERKFDIIHDKGTYDAVSLLSDADVNPADDNLTESRRIAKRNYAENVSDLLADGGVFIITSCNWTRQELVNDYSQFFTVVDEIPVQKFSFGGKSGQRETALVFEKKK